MAARRRYQLRRAAYSRRNEPVAVSSRARRRASTATEAIELLLAQPTFTVSDGDVAPQRHVQRIHDLRRAAPTKADENLASHTASDRLKLSDNGIHLPPIELVRRPCG